MVVLVCTREWHIVYLVKISTMRQVGLELELGNRS
jgi:hypothetical protein